MILNHISLKFNRTIRFVNLNRYIYSLNKTWPNEYNSNVAKTVESHWRPILEQTHKVYSENEQIKNEQPKKYVLSMFPYPSGRLHMGHVRVYTLSDVLARFYRMLGFNVVHPIGWDAFGLPAENAAIERNARPDEWTINNVDYMREQLKEMSFSFDWNREIFTCEPSYYKWTQYLFLKLYEKGFAYQSEALVNWDPVDKTVLAFEQIDENGKSWRSGATVERKYLKQWFIRSTSLAKPLLDSLDELNTEDWTVIKKKQRLWIGKCDGCFIDFKLTGQDFQLPVFTRHPYGVYGVSHIAVSGENILVKKYYTDLKDGDQLPCDAMNPFTNEKIPIFYYEKSDYGILNGDAKFDLDAHLGIPSLNEDDRQFSNQHSLKFTEIIQDGKLVNSQELNTLNTDEAFHKSTELIRSLSIGGYVTSERLKDWVMSRQRYWGTPCPIIYCDNCKVVPVPYEDLPVTLPPITNLSVKGLNELKNSDWHKTKCPKCNGDAKRETDTLDTFFDSSWYFLRYLDSKNDKELINADVAAKFMPVDIYIGGAEHALTHLFVSRFMSHFLHKENLLQSAEPFKRFIAIGMVKGESFKSIPYGKYVEPKYAEHKGNAYFHKDSGEQLERNIEKMSKSKLNGVDPQDMIQQYGVDFTRLFILGFVHPRTDRDFLLNKDMIGGTMNILNLVWNLVGSTISETGKTKSKALNESQLEKIKNEMFNIRNTNLSMIMYNLMDNFNMPSYLVAITKIAKFLKKVPVEARDDAYLKLLIEVLILMAPTTPHFACECWNAMRHLNIKGVDKDKLIIEQKWPKIDDNFPLVLHFNVYRKPIGKHTLLASQMENLQLDDALSLFKQHGSFDKHLTGPLSDYTFKLQNQYPFKAVLTITNKNIANKDVDENDSKSTNETMNV